MGRKCSVENCKTGYKNQNHEKITVYKFPLNLVECHSWVSCLPNKISLQKVTTNMGICALHWPPDVDKIRSGRYLKPSVPPSIFPNIPESCDRKIKCRETGVNKVKHKSKLKKENRNPDNAEMQLFLETDSSLMETDVYFTAHDHQTNPRVGSIDDGTGTLWNEDFNVCLHSLKRETPFALEISQKLSELKNKVLNILAHHGYDDRADEGTISQLVDLLMTDELHTLEHLASVLDVKSPGLSLAAADTGIPDLRVRLSSSESAVKTRRSSTRKKGQARKRETMESGDLEEKSDDTNLTTHPVSDTHSQDLPETQSDDTHLTITHPVSDTHSPDLPAVSPLQESDGGTAGVDQSSSPHTPSDSSITSPRHSLSDVTTTKNGESTDKCLVCGQVYPENCTPSEHLKNCWVNYKHYCATCGRTFSTSAYLTKHKKCTHATFVKCTVCGQKLAQKSLERHMNNHTGGKTYKCSMCDEAFYLKRDLNAHILTHAVEKPTICSVCDKDCISNSGFLIHMKTHRERPFKCSLCDKSFLYRPHLLTHIRAHERDKNAINKCSICDKTFTSRKNLRCHKRIHFVENKRYKCASCDKRFFTKSSLNVHNRSHTGEKPYLCSTCGKALSDMTTFKRHKKMHTGEKPHTCNTCGKAFSERFKLNIHMAVHTGEKRFQCSTCGKRYSTNFYLTTHKRMHTGEKPFECTTCSKKFYSKFSLCSHMVRVHAFYKPFGCSTCGKKFVAKADLNIHKRTHTGEKPYICRICAKAFTSLSNLRRHKKTHMAAETETETDTHPPETEISSSCSSAFDTRSISISMQPLVNNCSGMNQNQNNLFSSYPMSNLMENNNNINIVGARIPWTWATRTKQPQEGVLVWPHHNDTS